ncbi:MAG TPA: FAD-binding oxidoreductase [Nevskiaceae bacterium]|nr:FAD-binding oxidoreductase [Nevskiaceae bacterium]
MRRWNGWGEVGRDAPLSAVARAFLGERLGPAAPPRDASLEQVLAKLPGSRLPDGTPFETDAELRLRHAHGQSLPDWLALRYGRVGPCADGVARPRSHDEAATALSAALKLGARVVPYGGGTSVVGHLAIPGGDQPIVNISLERMDSLQSLDEVSRLACFEAGTPGPRLEAQLAQRGYVLGHFPQSWEYSTLGGWIVARSSGQQSLRYGRIERLLSSARLATPRGEWRVGGFPASAAGIDLREVVMGSEGRLGLVTEATVRVRPLPETEIFHGVFFPSWEIGLEAARAITQADVPLSMLRMSNALETFTQLTLAGHERSIHWLRRYLALRGAGQEPVMMVLGMTGTHREVRRMRGDALSVARRHDGVPTGQFVGKAWAKQRFAGPYLRNSLWDAGYAVDTVETALDWPRATTAMNAIEAAARSALAAESERVHAFTHLSHVYPQGCSIYSTFVFRLAGDYDHDLERWKRLKAQVSKAIVESGGTISHQHGVGRDHAPYLVTEKGAVGLDVLRAIAHEMDPQGLMNPGKLVL